MTMTIEQKTIYDTAFNAAYAVAFNAMHFSTQDVLRAAYSPVREAVQRAYDDAYIASCSCREAAREAARETSAYATYSIARQAAYAAIDKARKLRPGIPLEGRDRRKPRDRGLDV